MVQTLPWKIPQYRPTKLDHLNSLSSLYLRIQQLQQWSMDNGTLLLLLLLLLLVVVQWKVAGETTAIYHHNTIQVVVELAA